MNEGEKLTGRLLQGLFGHKETGTASPCYYCGVITRLLNFEDFRVCERCQKLQVELSYDEMCERYPLRGKDERNQEWFDIEKKTFVERARRLTKQEIEILEASLESEHPFIREALDNIKKGDATESELLFLGRRAEYILDRTK